jgi:hypothetical protein
MAELQDSVSENGTNVFVSSSRHRRYATRRHSLFIATVFSFIAAPVMAAGSIADITVHPSTYDGATVDARER